MDTIDCITSKVEVRQFQDKPVPPEVKSKVLEAARLTGSSNNTQHWRFILIQEKENLKRLAQDSTTGGWVSGADFAVIVLTNPKVNGHLIDAGRALQDMQLAAWSMGVGSGIFTGVNKDKIREDYGIPAELESSAFLGFGYPMKKITGKRRKKRAPMQQIAFSERYGNELSEPSRGL